MNLKKFRIKSVGIEKEFFFRDFEPTMHLLHFPLIRRKHATQTPQHNPPQPLETFGKRMHFKKHFGVLETKKNAAILSLVNITSYDFSLIIFENGSDNANDIHSIINPNNPPLSE